MTEKLQKCDNCLKMFPDSKIATHFGYCRRNIKKCDKCNQLYDINFLDEHQEQYHTTIACQFCKKQFGTTEIDPHTKNCPHKPKFCEYCELNVPPAEFNSHLRQCESRTQKCDQCRQPITNKQYLIHITTCKGIVEPEVIKQPKNYAQHIKQQRSKVEEPRSQYARVKYQYKPAQEKPQSFKKIEVSSRDSKPNNYRAQSNKEPQRFSKYNINGNKPVLSNQHQPYGISEGRSRQAKNKVGSYKNIDNQGLDNRRAPKQEVSTKNYLYHREQINNNPVNIPSRGTGTTGTTGTTGSRPLRQDPPIMNSRQTKPNSYGNYKKDQANSYGNYKKDQANSYGNYKKDQPNSYGNYRKDEPKVISNQRIQINKPGLGNQPIKPVVNSYKPSVGSIASRNTQIPTKNIQPASRPQKRNQPKEWDPQDYGGYINDNQLPQEALIPNPRNDANLGGIADQDEQLQKAIMMSMGLQKKNQQIKHQNLPKQFDNEDVMNQSFYKDMDLEKQKALYEEAQGKNRRR